MIGYRDAIQNPSSIEYGLIPLEPKEGAGIFDWTGLWGSFHVAPNYNPPPGPAHNEVEGIFKTTQPVEFYEKCRKVGVDLENDPVLLKMDGTRVYVP